MALTRTAQPMNPLRLVRRRGYLGTQNLLARAGYDFRRKPHPKPSAPAARAFYEPTDTCQIRYLGSLYEAVFGQRRDGFFVEVGAFDGISFSNSSCLAAVGWRGVLVEPVPTFAARCRERYADNPRVQVCECAVGADDREIELIVGGPLTTANELLAREYLDVGWAKNQMRDANTTSVRQRTLDQLLSDESVEPGFEVLVVDVEGYEQAVFASFDLECWWPQMVIVELADTHPDLTVTRAGDAQLARRLVDQGYDVLYKDVINTVFVRRDRWHPAV